MVSFQSEVEHANEVYIKDSINVSSDHENHTNQNSFEDCKPLW